MSRRLLVTPLVRRCLFVTMALLSAAPAASAQDVTNGEAAARTQSPDARRILQESADACRRVQTIEYEETQESKTAGDGHEHTLRARVRQARAVVPHGGFLPGKFSVEGAVIHRDAAPAGFAYSYDGRVLRVLDTEEKVVKVVRSPSAYVAGSLLGGVGTLGVPQFTEEQPFKSVVERSERVEHEGTRNVHGVECHVVAVTSTVEHPAFGKRSFVTRWFIGVADRLPRGRESGGTRNTVRLVRVNGPLAESAFVFRPQRGFGERLVSGVEPKRKGLLPAGTLAPDWRLPDAQGREHSLSDYKGKLVLLDFWGTWCVPCRVTMPGIQSIHERFKDRGVAVLGVAIGGDEAGDPAAYMRAHRFTYGLLLKGDEVAALYNVGVLPGLYLIGDDGRIIHAEYGYREAAKDELTRMIDGYLKARGR